MLPLTLNYYIYQLTETLDRSTFGPTGNDLALPYSITILSTLIVLSFTLVERVSFGLMYSIN